MKEKQMRVEYPRPNLVRSEWMSLNGEWDFWLKPDPSWGHEDIEILDAEMTINVPFSYQAELSGIGSSEIYDLLWYRRIFDLPKTYENKKLYLHFGAVDYIAEVWVNSIYIGSHQGGHTPFSFEISHAVKDCNNIVVVKVIDYTKDMTLPRGKQFWQTKSKSIFYTPTTGIWQPVWLEPVEETMINKVRFTPDIDTSQVCIDLDLKNYPADKETMLMMKIRYSGKDVSQRVYDEVVHEASYKVCKNKESYAIVLNNFNHQGFERWWTPETPNLYYVDFELKVNDTVVDVVQSYFGMRKISIDNGIVNLNNKPYYMKLVLDQGYFPDGNLTPPSDEAIIRDIELTKAMGFNGVRKHQKIEDPRYLYWSDVKGLLVWGEMANAYDFSSSYIKRMIPEWIEAVERDYNHPSVVAWVPINESWGIPNVKHDKKQQEHARTMYYLTKSLDQTRPVMSNDGWEHVISDFLTIHDYEWNEDVLRRRYASVENILEFMSAGRFLYESGTNYKKEPIILTEFGGVAFAKRNEEGWGYSGVNTEEDFLKRFDEIVSAVYESNAIQGICYTQLTDVEQEINGLLTYNRESKVPLADIKKIIDKKRSRK